MDVKKVTKKNLEFLTNQLQPEETITLNKKTNTYVFYDEEIKAVVQQRKQRKTQRFEITKYDPDFSTSQIIPLITKQTKYLELPKEESLEEIMNLMNYQKIDDKNGYQTYERKKQTMLEILNLLKSVKQFNIKSQFKDYFNLWKDEPEFKSYELLNIISRASSGALLGSVMPSFWDYGGVLKIAGILSAIQQIATPLTNVVTSGTMGKLVDKAAVQTDIKNLKNLQKKVGGLYTFTALNTYLMQPGVLQLSPSPEAMLLTLFALHTVGTTAGKMGLENKSFFAIKDYLIRKNPELENEEYKDKFYQIVGTGQALAQLSYAATFASAWLTCKSNPAMIFPIATVSAISLIASKFLWGFQRNLKDPVTIGAKEYIEKGNSYVFDTAWTIEPEEDTVLEKKFGGYKLPLRKGINIKSEYVIGLKKLKKGLELSTIKSKIKLKTKKDYELKKINNNEYSIRLI